MARPKGTATDLPKVITKDSYLVTQTATEKQTDSHWVMPKAILTDLPTVILTDSHWVRQMATAMESEW
jgi:hypothetical protein